MSREKKLLESPFAWEISQNIINKNYDKVKQSSSIVTVDDQPVIAVMESLMGIYCSATKRDYEKAKQQIIELHEIRDNIDADCLISENVSIKVLDHIIWSTLFRVYELAGDLDAAEVAFEQIPDLTDNPIDNATIHGCKAIAWSTLDKSCYMQAIAHATRAVAEFHNCPLWQFLLYKNLRRSRILQASDSSQLWKEEKQAIFECTRTSINPFYLIYQAQMYEEYGHFDLAQLVYQLAYEAKPKSIRILLKLVKGFIKGSKMEMAKECLDEVKKKCPDDPMFLQTKGLYLYTLGKYEEAAKDFQAAAACGIHVADIRYVACKMKADKKFDHIKHLTEMLEKYKDPSDRQNILLHLAMHYRHANDFPKACKCFVEAIQIDRQSEILKSFQNQLSLMIKKTRNVFDYVEKFLPDCNKTVDFELLNQLKELCQESK